MNRRLHQAEILVYLDQIRYQAPQLLPLNIEHTTRSFADSPLPSDVELCAWLRSYIDTFDAGMDKSIDFIFSDEQLTVGTNVAELIDTIELYIDGYLLGKRKPVNEQDVAELDKLQSLYFILSIAYQFELKYFQ